MGVEAFESPNPIITDVPNISREHIFRTRRGNPKMRFQEAEVASRIINMRISKTHKANRTRSTDIDSDKFDVVFILARSLAFCPTMCDEFF